MTFARKSHWRGTIRVWAALAFVGAGVIPASAQEASRPFRGLFGGSDFSVRPVLSISASALVGHDNDLGADLSGAGAPTEQRAEGAFRGFNSGVSFARPGRRLSLFASGSSLVRYYPVVEDLISAGYTGSGTARVHFGERSWLMGRAGADYTPHFAFSGEPESVDAITGAPARYRPYASSSQRVATYDAGLAFGQTLTSRSSFMIGQDLRYADSLDRTTDTRDLSVAAEFSHRYHRTGSVRLAYLFRRSAFFGFATRKLTRVQTLNADFTRDLVHSRTRRTTLTFGLGPTILEQPGARRFGLAGNAGLSHDMGRTWTARAAYRYGYNFIEGLPDPVLSQSGNGSVSGLFGRRVDLTVGVSAVAGDEGLGVVSTSYDTYSGTARLGVALSRIAAIYGEYLFHHVRFGRGVVLPPGYVREQDRHGVRVGLSLFVPVLAEKGSNAAR